MIRNMDDLTFEMWQAEWYRLNRDLFGEREANRWLKANLNHHTILKKLWIEKGFKTYGEYRVWETEHIAERNAYFEARGVKYGSVHTGDSDGWNMVGSDDQGGRENV